VAGLPLLTLIAKEDCASKGGGLFAVFMVDLWWKGRKVECLDLFLFCGRIVSSAMSLSTCASDILWRPTASCFFFLFFIFPFLPFSLKKCLPARRPFQSGVDKADWGRIS